MKGLFTGLQVYSCIQIPLWDLLIATAQYCQFIFKYDLLLHPGYFLLFSQLFSILHEQLFLLKCSILFLLNSICFLLNSLQFDKVILNLKLSFSSPSQLGSIYKCNQHNLCSFILLINEILTSAESHMHILPFWYTDTYSLRKVCPVIGSKLQCFHLNNISTRCL